MSLNFLVARILSDWVIEINAYQSLSSKDKFEVIMREWDELLAIADKLLGPEGCPWDREQTLFTLQPYLLEEAHEVIEAIDAQNGPCMAEEVGDVLYLLIFIAKVGEKEKKFTLVEAIRLAAEKLIRRHPHVFGEVSVENNEEIIRNWEEIKKTEGKGRTSILDGIPATLPVLARAQKVISKINRSQSKAGTISSSFQSEEELGDKLWGLIEAAEEKGWNVEGLLRREVTRREQAFRDKTPEMGS